jgi:type VI protein secretion system component VasF
VRDDLANQVYDVLLHGLKLRDRVAGGERPHLGTEQARLKSMLGSASSPPPWGGDHDPTKSTEAGHAAREFLGIRYALTCWLDELLIDAGWREWDEHKLESALYRTNIRYSNFWGQARLAEAIPSAAEAQEVFLLCALLGFRGEMAETPERLREWVQTTRSRVTRHLGKELPPLPERAPVTDVPPLLGVEGYRRMTRRFVGGVLVAVLLTAFLVVALFWQK